MAGKRGPDTYRGETRDQLKAHGEDAYKALLLALAIKDYDKRFETLSNLVNGVSANQRNAVVGAMIVYLCGQPPLPPASRPTPPKPSAPAQVCRIPATEAA
jgi:hypothetical protein